MPLPITQHNPNRSAIEGTVCVKQATWSGGNVLHREGDLGVENALSVENEQDCGGGLFRLL